MVKKFTKEGRCCQDFIEKFENRMTLLKTNFPNLVDNVKTVYECKFNEFLKNGYAPDFESTFMENALFKERQYFSRLVPRDACLLGKKDLLCLCWNKHDFPNENFYYLT